MAAFYLYPKNLPEAKLKRNGLISKAGEISRQFNNVSFMQLLVTTLRQVYNEYEQEGRNKYKMHSLERKKDTGKVSITAQACAGRETETTKGIRVIKERPNLHWNKGKVPPGQDPT